jgi:hypothetical protein
MATTTTTTRTENETSNSNGVGAAATLTAATERARAVLRNASELERLTRERIDRTTSDAAFRVAKTIETAREAVGGVAGTAAAHAEALAERAKEEEDAFFKRASKWATERARENPATTCAGALAFLAVALPGPRTLIWRSTIGRLQSEEAIFNACVRRSESLALDAEAARMDIQNLAAAAAEAEAEMKRGAANLRAAARSLKSIESKTYGMDARVTALLNDLRVLPGKEAVELRGVVASTSDVVASRRNAALAALKRIYKSGIEV